MKAIAKFKSLLTPRPPNSQKRNQQPATLSVPPSSAPEEKPTDEQSTAEFAARVLRERQAFLAATGGGDGRKPSIDQLLNAPFLSSSLANPTTTTTTDQGQQGIGNQSAPILGIGTGGIDDFPNPHDDDGDQAGQAAGVVSDSPTVVDFNVYDRAFEEECERIKRSSSRRGGGGRPHGKGAAAAVGAGTGAGAGAGGAAPGSGAGTIYQTRLSERGEGGGGEGGRTSNSRGLWGAVSAAAAATAPGQGRAAGSRFADLVARAMEEGKEEGLMDGIGKNEGEGKGGSDESQR